MRKAPQLSHNSCYGMSLPLIVWIIGLFFLLKGDYLLSDPDSYWHTATGNWIISHGKIPDIDPFSHSMAGKEWVAHEWLSEVVLFLIQDNFGWAGMAALAVVVSSATLALITRFLLNYLNPRHVLIVIIPTSGLIFLHMLARPHVFSFLLLALWLWGLVVARDKDERPSYLLIPIMVLWANLHGSFSFGIFLAFVFTLEAIVSSSHEKRKSSALQWIGFTSASVVAATLTPAHVEGLMFTFHLMILDNSWSYIQEWSSPDFHKSHMRLFEMWLLGLFAIALAGRLKLPVIRLLLTLFMIHMTLKHQRFIPIAGIVLPFILAAPISQQFYKVRNNIASKTKFNRTIECLAQPASNGARFAVLAISVVILSATIMVGTIKPVEGITPQSAMNALRDNSVTGPIFNAYNFGGYLIYSGEPVFIDGRADMYGDKFMKSYMDAVNLRNPDGLLAILRDFEIEATMLQPKAPAAALLDNLPDWKRLYADDIAIVHVRKESAVNSLVLGVEPN